MSEKHKGSRLFLLTVFALILVGCGNGDSEEYVDNEEDIDKSNNIKTESYVSISDRRDLNIVIKEGEYDDPVSFGELVHVAGNLKTGKHQYKEGEFSAGVKRVLREDSALYRIDERVRDLIDKKDEWVIVELEVYNWGVEDSEKLTFLPDDFVLYDEDKKEIPKYDVGFNTDPKRVSVYGGKPEIVTLVTQVEEGKDFLVGITKKQTDEEKEKEEEEKEGKKKKDKETKKDEKEKGKKKDKKKKDEDEELSEKEKKKKERKEAKKKLKSKVDKKRDIKDVKFLTIKDATTLTDFDLEKDEELESGKGTEKEIKNKSDKETDEGIGGEENKKKKEEGEGKKQ